MKPLTLVVFILTISTQIWCQSSGNDYFDDVPKGKRHEKTVNRTPIIIGDGGSRIYIKVLNPNLCTSLHSWFHIWLNFLYMALPIEHCLTKFFALRYNSTTRRTYTHPQVLSKVFYWGGTGAIEKLDIFPYEASRYFQGLVRGLVSHGYWRNMNIRGAPYDFRRAPNENLDFTPKLKALIEETYYMNGRKRVLILAHSLGNLYTLFFLKQMSSAWKKKFVRGYAAVSPPLGGALKPLKLVTSGDALSKYVLSVTYMRIVEQSMPSTMFLFPSPLYWKPDEILLSLPGRNYTIKDYHQLFKDIDHPDGWEMYKDTSNLVDPRWVPDVDELYCIHGVGIPTADKYVWKSDADFPYEYPTPLYGDGDGTVNLRSLRICHGWPNVRKMIFHGSNHVGIIKEQRFIEAIRNILMH